MKVLKFGGSSIGDATCMLRVADIVNQQRSVLVVLSAISGTTNKLLNIAAAIKDGELDKARITIKELNNFYNIYINELFVSPSVKTKANEFIQTLLADISETVQHTFSPSLEYRLLAKGELLSTQLFHLVLIEKDIDNSLLNALDFLRHNEINEPDEAFLKEQLTKLINDRPSPRIFITQGYICRNAFGEISNLKRGGSDYSASLFGAALECEEIQI